MARYPEITRLYHLFRIIEDNPGLNTKELTSKLQKFLKDNQIDAQCSQRTVERDIASLKTELGAEIEFDRAKGGYVVKQWSNHNNWLRIMEAGFLHSLIGSKPGVISLDSRQPKGLVHIPKLLQAIRESRLARVYHTAHTYPQEIVYELIPLAIKEALGMWYLICCKCKDWELWQPHKKTDELELRHFGLDRIREVRIMDQSFEYPIFDPKKGTGFSLEKAYEGCMGIVNDDNYSIQEVIIKCESLLAARLRTYKLHTSQVEKPELSSEHDGKVVFVLTVRPSYDLESQLLAFGDEVEVVSPEPFREAIQAKISRMMDIYKKTK